MNLDLIRQPRADLVSADGCKLLVGIQRAEEPAEILARPLRIDMV